MLVDARNLSHRYGDAPALFSDLSFTLHPGSLIGIVGASGSGKSTLLSLIAGFQTPDMGSVEVSDGARVGWILQNPQGVPRRSVLDHVVFPLLTQGLVRCDAEVIAWETLRRFDIETIALSEFRYISGGEAQRLCFARAAVANFDVLLLDEPTAQLDPTSAKTVAQVARSLVGPQKTVVVATHDQRLIAQCDELISLGA